MTCGIYKIYLGESDRYYIGQSTNIDMRIKSHMRALIRGDHYNYKMQNTYNVHNKFSYEIIKECNIEDLNAQEYIYINEYCSLINGYNILPGGNTGSNGLNHSQTKYTRDQLVNVFLKCTDPSISLQFISNIFSVDYSTVIDISNRSTHQWLSEEYPEEAKVLDEIRINRVRLKYTNRSVSYKYKVLISPSGESYNVDDIISMRQFCKEHNLQTSGISNLLHDKIQSKKHKGWTAIMLKDDK